MIDDFFDELVVGILEAILDNDGFMNKLKKKMRDATPEEVDCINQIGRASCRERVWLRV